MGVMVLDPYDRPGGRVPRGPLSGAVTGVPVGRKKLGFHPGDRLQLRFGALERMLCGEVVHVSDMGGQPGPATFGETEGVLQIAPDGEGRPHGYGQCEGQGA